MKNPFAGRGWPNRFSVYTPRRREEQHRIGALYAALGASPDRKDHLLGELPDGRFAVVTLENEGFLFAVESYRARQPRRITYRVGNPPQKLPEEAGSRLLLRHLAGVSWERLLGSEGAQGTAEVSAEQQEKVRAELLRRIARARSTTRKRA